MFTVAWAILALVAIVLILAGGYILYSPADATLFTGITGLDPDSLQSSSPDLARYVTVITRLLAVAVIGFGILALFVTWFGVRDRSPLSINIMWTLPLLVGSLGLTLVLEGSVLIGLALAGLTAILCLALVIARRHS